MVNRQAVAPADSSSIDAALRGKWIRSRQRIRTTSRGEVQTYAAQTGHEQVKTGPGRRKYLLYWMGVCLMDAQQTDKAKKFSPVRSILVLTVLKSCQILYKLFGSRKNEGGSNSEAVLAETPR